jgi:hypothetical protein
MLGQPPAVWKGSAKPRQFITARGGAPESDMGERSARVFAPTPPSSSGTRVYLTRDLPIEFNADLGFGESVLDLTRLRMTNAYVETGASHVTIFANEPNPEVLNTCTIKAGLGGCTFLGISNLNIKHLDFKGAVGTYRLGFEGRLVQDMDAYVDMGIGFCTIAIPPVAGRVRVFYDESMFSTYEFRGLVMHHDGFATSPGFDLSNAPVLTLHLSNAAGKTAVIYH